MNLLDFSTQRKPQTQPNGYLAPKLQEAMAIHSRLTVQRKKLYLADELDVEAISQIENAMEKQLVKIKMLSHGGQL